MTGEEDAQLQAFQALQALRDADDGLGANSGAAVVPASRIVVYAQRSGSTADLALERALRHAPGLRRLYRRALSGVAQASSMQAAAASDARVTRRMIGPHVLEILCEADGMSWLVLRLADAEPAATMLELRAPDGSGQRLPLGEPIDGVIQLPLDPAYPLLAGLAELIGDPGCELYLL